jgi:hypothetical protein
MTTAPRVVGNHAYFFRDGDPFTVPGAGTASRTSLPGAEDPAWIDLGVILDAAVEKSSEEREVWAPNPGRIELHDIVETKRNLVHKFTAQEMSPFMFEVLYGTDALEAASTDYTALEGDTKKGWLMLEQYDQNDVLINTVFSYVFLKIAGEVSMGDQLVTAPFEARQLISTLNAGTLVAS